MFHPQAGDLQGGLAKPITQQAVAAVSSAPAALSPSSCRILLAPGDILLQGQLCRLETSFTPRDALHDLGLGTAPKAQHSVRGCDPGLVLAVPESCCTGLPE